LKIKFAIVGAGVGAGLGMIWVAIFAARTSLAERVSHEAVSVMVASAVGLALGWMIGPRPRLRAAMSRHLEPATTRKPVPCAVAVLVHLTILVISVYAVSLRMAALLVAY
jgi:hypothetical protein